MDDRSFLTQGPFYGLTNYQLSIEFQLARTKYTEMLENNLIQKHLLKNIPQQILNSFQCKYYDEDGFNSMIKHKQVFLSLFHINIGSSVKNYNLLKAHLSNLCITYDIIAISEAGVRNIDLVRNIFEGYNFHYREPVHNTTKGGVGVFIKNELNSKLLLRDDLALKISNVEDIWFQVGDCIFAVIYKHPRSNNCVFIEGLESNLDNIVKDNKLCIICGDININLLQNSADVKRYTDSLLSHNFIPTITLPTRITDHSVTLLDHIHLYKPLKEIDRVAECGNIFFDISDHLPNFILLEGKTSRKVERPYIRIYSEKNISRFKTEMSNISWEDVYTCEGTNAAYNNFIQLYSSIYNKCFPLVQKSRKRCKDKKWITSALRVSIRYKTKLYKKYVSRPNLENKAAYTRYKNKLVALIREARRAYYVRLLTTDKSQVQQIWRVYSELLGRNTKSKTDTISKLVFDGKSITGDHSISNAFNDYFVKVAKDLQDSFPDNDNYKAYLNDQYNESMFLTPITEDELRKVIERLPPNKAAGLDGINSNMIKQTASMIVSPLTHIFNLSFSQAIVPTQLKISKVIPVFKKKDRASPGNYRPISLLSIFNKLLEKLMYQRLYSFLTQKHILYDYQFGFRNKHSTILALTEIVDNIREELDKGNSVLGIYLDLSKAFDTVNHDILLYKLSYYGIRGHAYQWLKDYLTERTQYIYVNRTVSDARQVSVGVPQGSVLGPLLFLIYINDLSCSMNNAKTRLFADDTNLFFSDKCISKLQDEANIALIRLHEWFVANKLTLNIDKTCYSIFTNKKSISNVKVLLNNNEIARVVVTKYLGMYLDEKLSWSHHVEYICNKLVRLKGAFNYLADMLTEENIKQLYYAYVFPHVKYGIEIYGTCSDLLMKKLQTEQNKLLKILCRKNRRYPTNQLHSELKVLNCYDIHKLFIGVFVYKQQSNMLPAIFDTYFKLNSDVCMRTTRQSDDLYIPLCRTKTAQRSLKYIGAKLWNSIGDHVKRCKTIYCFKRTYKSELIDSYAL